MVVCLRAASGDDIDLHDAAMVLIAYLRSVLYIGSASHASCGVC